MPSLSDPAGAAGGAAGDRGRRPVGTRRGETTLLLEEEPDLARGLSPGDTRAARAALRASVLTVTRRRWEPPQLDPSTTYGLLVLEGLLGRRMRVGPAVGTELLSCGDILRPWDEPLMWNLIPPELDWRVFRPVRLAVLDEPITRLIGSRPQLVVNFSGRLLRRTRSIAYIMAISHQPRVADKLLLTLWHLASNFGRVTADGVKIPFKLTHEVLGEIIGAQRPSVTTAMRSLQTSGQVMRVPGGGLVLLADPEDWMRTARGAVSAMSVPGPDTGDPTDAAGAPAQPRPDPVS